MRAARTAHRAKRAVDEAGAAVEDATASGGNNDAQENAQEASNQPQEKKGVVEEWFIDLGEGLTAIYLAVFDKREQCSTCVHNTVYPVKEGVMTCVDGVRRQMYPSEVERSRDFVYAAQFDYD
eukprot:CAMPEP_0172724720 /NCGR_PEP_ID=MMETSP1074-20121228/86737_1 /TAXON_ID=2916 /ORGANISM="Ceratium fusus, Strain PA161109" /LENGTH=122 /DNA_ID=CAMNT_0013551279 /DNA_START=101 /DNA_END=469 /DNA_ORIENTATION=+